MSANLLELQEMLRNLDMGSVQRVAQGQSGKAAQLLGMDEIKRRGEQMQEAQANEAEQQMQQPPMVDQYLAMSQQIMGQPPSMPPSMPSAMPPSIPAPPQQGIGSMMPPQAPPQMAAAPPAPTPQPPVQMMAGGGSVGSFIQKYQEGGPVEYGDIFSPIEEELADEDPGVVSELMDWIGENPGKVAALTTAGSLLIPGGLAIRGLSMGAKALLPRILPYLNRGRTAVGALGRRAGMTPKIDPRLGIPERAGRVYRPGAITEAIDQQLGRELTSVGLRRAAGAGTLGVGAYGLASLMGADGEEFKNPGAPFPLAPGGDDPEGEGAGEAGPDPIERAEVPVGEGAWQSLIALGAGIAGNENWGEGISEGLKGALGTYTAAQERAQKRADKQFEQDLLMEERPLRLDYLKSQTIRNLRDPYAGRGALTENQVKDQIAQYLQTTESIMPMDSNFYPRFQELFEIFKAGGSQALYAAMGMGGGGDDTAGFLSAIGMQ